MRIYVRPLVVCLAFMLAIVWPSPAAAQEVNSATEPSLADKVGKEFHAFHLAATPPRVDGRLDDEVWTVAETISDFVQMYPDNMEPATERTTAQVAYDDRYLYVAVHCYYKDPSQVSPALGRRDNIPRSDRIFINFDPRHDHLTAYQFQVNPSGVQGDNTVSDDTNFSFDYDGVWEASAQVVADGWSVELRIPFSQMRFSVPSGGQAVWGFNVERQIAKTGENVRWMPNPRGTQGFVSRFGHLIFGEPPAPRRRIELLPFALGSVQRSTNGDDNDASLSGGTDLRVGLGPSATLSATINPDFGQVEADPAVLNLSVFETFFPEKRAFFLEDSRVFVLPYPQAPDFYSRRIGQAPGRIALKDGDTLVSKPDQTTIFGAAKLTGKAGNWTYGGLGALTQAEYAVVDATTDSAGNAISAVRMKRLVEPATLYSVGRLQRDILHGSSNVGVLGTAVVRKKDLDAFTGGPDYNIRWNQNHYNLSGHWLVTRAPISGVVRTDVGGLANFSYSGKYLGVNSHYDHFGADFRNADVGFLSTRPDKNEINGGLNLNSPNPWKIFRNTFSGIRFNRQWNRDGLVFGKSVGFNSNLNFQNYWNINFGGTHNFRRFDDLDTRGGPPILRVANDFFYFNVNTDSRKRWQINPIGFNSSQDAAGGWSGEVYTTVRLQPSDRLQASIAVNRIFAQDIAQWIKNEDLDGDGTKENIYGRLRRDVVNITTRATYAFSSDMTLEAYVQPFVAVGDYTDIRKLARAKSFDFDPVSISDNPDFNRKSVRGTVVMRWEYLRGSTLFVVWNMSNSDTTRAGVFSPWRDLRSGITAPGTNVFVVKLSYWLTP